jgi:hypothetical protein
LRLPRVLSPRVVLHEARELLVRIGIDCLIALLERGEQKAPFAHLIEEPLAYPIAGVGDLGVGPVIVHEAPVALDGLGHLFGLVIGIGEAKLGQAGIAAVAVFFLHFLEELLGLLPVVLLERHHRFVVSPLGVLGVVQGSAAFGRATAAPLGGGREDVAEKADCGGAFHSRGGR